MNRIELKEIVRRNLHELYGLTGDVKITIQELSTIDNILMEIYAKNTCKRKQSKPKTPCHKQKISNSRKGQIMSEQQKERIRQNSQRINIYQYSLDGELVGVWRSTREVARVFGCSNSTISRCCNGKRKTAFGFVWKYKPIGEDDTTISIHIEKVYKKEHSNECSNDNALNLC
jgi:hypothetical protein